MLIFIFAHKRVGTVFDVSRKAEVYGPGKSYNLFAGRDGSKGLGMSSLKAEHAVSDYSELDEKDLKVLNDWHEFFAYVAFDVLLCHKLTHMTLAVGSGTTLLDVSQIFLPIQTHRELQTYNTVHLMYRHLPPIMTILP